MKNIKMCSWAAWIYAGPMDHALWDSFAQEMGIYYLQDKYQAHVSCVEYQRDYFNCKAVSPTFEVHYSVHQTASVLTLIKAPEIYFYALKRAETCTNKKNNAF